MKRMLLALALCLLVAPVLATNLNFQSPSDMDYVNKSEVHECAYGYCRNSYITWTNTTAGSNNYVSVWGSSYCGGEPHGYVMNANPSAMTYAAATWLSNSVPWGIQTPMLITFYDSSKTQIGRVTSGSIACWLNDGAACVPYNSAFQYPSRIEVSVVGGTAYIYRDGTLIGNTTPMLTNPYYIGFGTGFGGSSCTYYGSATLDDMVWGETENKYVLGNPETLGYFIKKDMITPANRGVAFQNGTIINAFNMTSTFSKSALSGMTSELVQLVNSDTGTVYATASTNGNATRRIAWDLETALFNSGAPNGFYYIQIPDSLQTSNQIRYESTGATLTLDRANYSVGDTATASGEVQLGGYWDTSTYSYKVAFRDAYGNYVHNSSALTSRIFSESYTFDDADTQGAYYAILMATPLTGGPDYWLALDYCQLTAYLNFDGYVNDETGTVISGAVVNITQDALIVNYTTGADGAYVANNFITGSQIIFNVTAAGHQQYYKTTTPLSATSTSLNFTLPSDTKTYYGLAIGGVAREGILTGIDISDGLGAPIEGATVVLQNTTNGNYHTKLTNIAGWYLADEGSSIVLISKRPYDVWGMKTGYSNSANYTVVAP